MKATCTASYTIRVTAEFISKQYRGVFTPLVLPNTLNTNYTDTEYLAHTDPAQRAAVSQQAA